MATLRETLGTAKQPNYNYSYRPPAMPNPYRGSSGFGANVSFPSGGQDQGLYSSLLARTNAESARAIPSTRFQAEYNYDPVLSRISAMGDMTIANARSEAAALKKRALIDSGDVDIATAVGADANTIEAARQNTFGTRQRLARDVADRSRMLDEATNSQNLFYSGERIRQMQEADRGRAMAETDFGQVLRDLLANIDTGLLFAEENERMRALEAARNAPPRGPTGGGTPPPPPPTDTPPPSNAPPYPGEDYTVPTPLNPGGLDSPPDLWGGMGSTSGTDPYLSELLFGLGGRRF